MKAPQSRTALHIKAALIALSIAAMTTQVAGAAAAPGMSEPPAAQASAAISVPGEPELLAWLAGLLRAAPVSGSWALLLAGIVGAWAIGHRRMSALADRSLDSYRLPRR